ncbi:MAG: hypothetical protein U0269_32915 [Polyangiales bacterium]
MNSARQTVTRIELVATGAHGSAGLFAWRHRVNAMRDGDEARLRASSAFDPALHELVRDVSSEWIALDGERDELDVGSVFACVCDFALREERDGGDAAREQLEARRDPRVWLTALDAEGDGALAIIGGVRIFVGDREVVPVSCCTDASSWAGWRAPIIGAGESWRPESGHDPMLGFRVTADEVEIELGYGGDPNEQGALVVLDRVSFEAAIASADARVMAFAALAERWIARRCTPEESVRINAWVRRTLGLERAR